MNEKSGKRLRKQGRLEEFNEVFKDIVDRAVFREFAEAELRDRKGPINYNTTVKAFKQGPHATTPIQICMNSIMKQPATVSKILNDLLMKGPPALADLYTVTVGLRENKFALTKDLLKFYNSVLADEIAQHTHRLAWRYGKEDEKARLHATMTVNFGDKPAGCIAITVVRETADMFGEGMEEAAWFLKNRTYEDDATTGSNTREGLLKLSEGLEAIVAFGGFKFKETWMTGEPNVDGIPSKVLCMI